MKFKSHDVRRMASCALCREVGIWKPNGVEIPTLLRIYESPNPKSQPHQFAHPRCLVKRDGGVDGLIRLPSEELGEIGIGEITQPQLRKVIAELSRRDKAELALAKAEGR